MTKREAVKQFNDLYPPETFRSHGWLDKLMRAEVWNNFTDMLCRDGHITMTQYETWTHPWKD